MRKKRKAGRPVAAIGIILFILVSLAGCVENGNYATPVHTSITETQIGGGVQIVEVVREVETISEPEEPEYFEFPFEEEGYYKENLTIEKVETTTDIGFQIDYNPHDGISECLVYLADYDDIYNHILNLYKNFPELRPGMIATGRYLTVNNMSYLVAPSNSGFRDIPDFNRKNQDAANAFKVIYAAFKWDGWIGPFRGCWGSPFYGQGLDYCDYLFKRGRKWENCLATLEAESTFGLGGTCYYGMLYESYPNTLEGYCNLLGDHNVSNDPWEQACFWNMPGYPNYQEGFCKIVRTIEGWYP